MARNDEREFRLRPRKPSTPRTQNEPAAWATAFKTVMHYVRASTVAKRANRIGGGAARRASIPKSQRCAIRVTYTRNAVRGQWRAHEPFAELAIARGYRDAGMRDSRMAISDLPIVERKLPISGSVTGKAVAKTDTQIAIATAANSFVILELNGLPASFQIGEKIAVRMQQGRAVIEQGPYRGR